MWLGRELARLCTDRVLSIDRAIIRGDDRPGVCGAIDCALLAWGRWPSRRARREPDPWCDKPSRDPDHDRLDDLRVGLDGNRAPSSYTTNLKGQQIAAYRYADTNFADYEEDHLIPLELGGAPSDPRNLWPEAYLVSLSDGRSVGAHVKDQLENKLKALVCAGSLPLAVARQEIATDWVRTWFALGGQPVPLLSGRAPATEPTPASSPSPEPSTPIATEPTVPAGLSVTITSLTSPVVHGSSATLQAQTAAGAGCTISVVYKSGPSSSQGLGPKAAAGSGVVGWTWTVGSRTTPGAWPVTGTCSTGDSSASADATFVVR